jgi:hypothetical protein
MKLISSTLIAVLFALGCNTEEGQAGASAASGGDGNKVQPETPAQPSATVDAACPVSCPAGADGKDGKDGLPGLSGVDGKDGTSCSVQENETGALVTCGDTKATLFHGTPGTPGLQGPKGDTGAAGQEGPMGPMGLTGPKGDKGDTGPSGSLDPQKLYTRKKGVTTSTGSITVSAKCDEEDIAISGGCLGYSTLNPGAVRLLTSAPGNYVVPNDPDALPNVWSCEWRAALESSSGAAYVLCLDLPKP